MAKQARGSGASDDGRLIKRRARGTASTDSRVETLDREDNSVKRPRIAGERPPRERDNTEDASADAPAEGDQTEADTDEHPDAELERGDGDDSETMANDLATGDSKRRRLPDPVAAAAIGIVVGALLTGLVYAGMETFQAIYHTPAGDATGAVVLVAVLIACTVAGKLLLKRCGLPDPNATTILGIMLMAIVTLGVLLPIVFSAWMLLITPLLGGTTYLLSHLVIARFSDG